MRIWTRSCLSIDERPGRNLNRSLLDANTKPKLLHMSLDRMSAFSCESAPPSPNLKTQNSFPLRKASVSGTRAMETAPGMDRGRTGSSPFCKCGEDRNDGHLHCGNAFLFSFLDVTHHVSTPIQSDLHIEGGAVHGVELPQRQDLEWDGWFGLS